MQLIGASYWYAGQEAQARPAYAEADAILDGLQHWSVLASVRRGAGLMAARCGERERGAELCNKALTFSEQIGDRSGAAQALNFLAEIARDVGEPTSPPNAMPPRCSTRARSATSGRPARRWTGSPTVARASARRCSPRACTRAPTGWPSAPATVARRATRRTRTADDEHLRATLAPGELERASHRRRER